MLRDDRKATQAQIDYIRWLVQETKSDPKWFDYIEQLTRRQAQEIIDRLGEGIDASEWEG